ncbi:MAG TPA: quinone oxidoreductase, partial [Gemmatimonadetes bacterium]|nr:quinone oxidoreductase [Gemmatimonadota bacterium]
MSGAVVISQLGGPEVLEWVEKDPGEVGPDEVRVRHT